MKKKNSNKKIIKAFSLSICIVVSIIIIYELGVPKYTDTLKANWTYTLPKTRNIVEITNSRGGLNGDGESIYELYYKDNKDIENLKNYFEWVNGTDILNYIPNDTADFIKPTLSNNAMYFYNRKNTSDFIVFKLDLDKNKLTVYESYS